MSAKASGVSQTLVLDILGMSVSRPRHRCRNKRIWVSGEVGYVPRGWYIARPMIVPINEMTVQDI